MEMLETPKKETILKMTKKEFVEVYRSETKKILTEMNRNSNEIHVGLPSYNIVNCDLCNQSIEEDDNIVYISISLLCTACFKKCYRNNYKVIPGKFIVKANLKRLKLETLKLESVIIYDEIKNDFKEIKSKDKVAILSPHGKDEYVYATSVVVIDRQGNFLESKIFHIDGFVNPIEMMDAAAIYAKNFDEQFYFDFMFSYKENDEDNIDEVINKIKTMKLIFA